MIIKEITKGRTFYESYNGRDLKFVAIEDACHSDELPKIGWIVRGQGDDGDIVEFFTSDAAPHYGPKLHWSPQYASFHDYIPFFCA